MMGETIAVNIGDLVVYSAQPDASVAVVTEVRPSLHVADILDSSSGEGLILGLPGTVTNPVEVVGSIPLSDILMGYIRQLKDPSGIDYDAELEELKKAEAEGPVEFPRLSLGQYITTPEKTEIGDINIDTMPEPDENPQLAKDVAKFILREVWDRSAPEQFELDGLIGQMRRRTTLVAFGKDGQILATGSIQKSIQKYQMVITDMAVKAGSREIGLGTRIMLSLEEIARAKGAKRISLIAINDTDEFYEKEDLGYRLDGTHHVKDLTK